MNFRGPLILLNWVPANQAQINELSGTTWKFIYSGFIFHWQRSYILSVNYDISGLG